jgi:signal peptidase I
VRPHDEAPDHIDSDGPPPDRAAAPVTASTLVDDEPIEATDAVAPASGERRKRRKRSSRRNTIEWIIVIAGALLVAFVIKTFLIQAFYIPTGSMEPTLKVGDRVLVNKLSYDLHDVHRGDIVVFERPDNAGPGDTEDLIKRVVALPGETVEARDGRVYVDGERLEEPYLEPGMETPDFAVGRAGPVEVPEGHVFVLGDNRGNSSASNVFGPIEEDLIVGRAFIRVWPIGDFGGL